MIYNDFCGEKVSALGFGMMRLPTMPQGKETDIDIAKTKEMIDFAISNGVNYFDTACPYHGGMSEVVTGDILSAYPRDKYFLATKYPGHQAAESYDPAKVFEGQLKKCKVEYFDFYLLHNVCENSAPAYLDPKWGIAEYFIEQKRLGRIRHLGFSTHGQPDFIRKFLDLCGSHMEFCQIQLNYLDWTLQNAKEKCDILGERNIPVIVMEPLRGGKLARLSESAVNELKASSPDASAVAWAFRWLQNIPQVKLTLSGMSSPEQIKENVEIFDNIKPLSEAEKAILENIAEGMKNSLPCTGCRYCCDGCPMGLDIPSLIGLYNDLRFASAGFTVGMLVDSMPEEKRPTACIGCGACTQICPQSINIPEALRDMAEKLYKMPKWADICKAREEAAKKLNNN